MGALLDDGTWDTRDGVASPGGSALLHQWANTADELRLIGITNDGPPTFRKWSTADGGRTDWTLDAEDTLPAGVTGINQLVLPFRAGKFRVLGFGDVANGGEYTSDDEGLTWVKSGAANAQRVLNGNASTVLQDALGWTATSGHVYYIMKTEQSDPANGLFSYAVYVDDQHSGTPEVQRLTTVGTVSGGTFKLKRGTTETAALNWNDNAATILAALNAVYWFGAGGSASGSLAGDNLDITFPMDGPQPILEVVSSLTGGGTIRAGRLSQCAGIAVYGGAQQHHRLTTVGTVSGGTFTLTVLDETTGPLNWNDSGATIIAALNALSTFQGTADGGSLAGDNLNVFWDEYGPEPGISVDNTNITGGGSVGIAIIELGRFANSPNHPEAVPGVFNELWGAIDADVCMIQVVDGDQWVIEKIIGTSGPVDVTPSQLDLFDAIFRMRSRDGDTWVASCFIDIEGGNNLITSHDQGATWTVTTSGIDASDGWDDVAPDPVTPGVWWAIAQPNSLQWKIYKSTDDGDSWVSVSDPAFLDDGALCEPIGGKVH